MASGDTKTEALLKALENGGELDNIVGCCNTKMQDYILDNIDAVNSAKDVITSKGGTVGDTGLAGLAEEIETIPSGGGTEDWGTIKYQYLDSDPAQTLTIQSAYEYSTLCTSDANPIIDGESRFKSGIREVSLGSSATFAGNEFLKDAYNLVKLDGTENLIEIGYGFLFGCTSFNQALNLSHIRHIGDQFLHGCTSFNQPLDLSGAESIGIQFLLGCSGFNSSIHLPNITSIGTSFLSSCTMFNQPLTLPDTLTDLGPSFLNNCTSFNQPIDLSHIQRIGNSFMEGCSSFSQSLTIPSGVTSVGTRFMYNCNNFTGTLTCESGSGLSTSNQTLATQTNSAPMYATGVTLAGSNASDWKTKFADRTSSPYRKLIVSS